MDLKIAWDQMLSHISQKISRMEFGTWFQKVQLGRIQGNTAVIFCPTEMCQNWLENKYYSLILANIQKVLPEIEQVFFEVNLSLADQPAQNGHIVSQKAVNTPRKLPNRPEVRLEKGLDSRIVQAKFTLDNFVVGNENKFAHAACVAIAETPINHPKKYNPLYIHGGVGLGKTHLLQATANEIIRRNPDAKVIYTTAERFTNEMIKAIQTRKTEDLRKKYRRADVLLIDDVQFFAGKEQTQVELFNTFNDLRDLEKQIIFAADRPPAQIENLMDRLSSRMGWGLIVDVEVPSFETKVAIIQIKAAERSLILPEEVQHFMATNIRRNMRELENVLNKVAMELELGGISPTVQSVGKIFRQLHPQDDLVTDTENTSLAKTPDDIITFVSDYFQVPATDLLGKSRKKEIVYPRQICWLLCKEILKMSYEAIGEAFGGKNHTTIMHGIRKLDHMVHTDSATARHVHALKKDLGVK